MTRFALAALLLAAPTALAQESDDGVDEANVIYAAETLVDFNEVEVNGTTVKPSFTWIAGDARKGFVPMIRLRANWNPEMAASVDEVN